MLQCFICACQFHFIFESRFQFTHLFFFFYLTYVYVTASFLVSSGILQISCMGHNEAVHAFPLHFVIFTMTKDYLIFQVTKEPDTPTDRIRRKYVTEKEKVHHLCARKGKKNDLSVFEQKQLQLPGRKQDIYAPTKHLQSRSSTVRLKWETHLHYRSRLSFQEKKQEKLEGLRFTFINFESSQSEIEMRKTLKQGISQNS